ncbi:hypothetical protein MLD38_029595 [Melastoma candidum]|uniref:Uncharacterized protein n=1 Tax=Melastoma candidum TaxID=119954 RepID=A0ACB9N4B1_9MYRT|nr:hypothetical protein MLD38_029595 [Melastoma candidum]
MLWPPKCQLGCGQPTQRWHRLPRSWLKPSDNLWVIFEDLGGNPSKMSFQDVCSEEISVEYKCRRFGTPSDSEESSRREQLELRRFPRAQGPSET